MCVRVPSTVVLRICNGSAFFFKWEHNLLKWEQRLGSDMCARKRAQIMYLCKGLTVYK